jgi:hypothetical protein
MLGVEDRMVLWLTTTTTMETYQSMSVFGSMVFIFFLCEFFAFSAVSDNWINRL